MKHEEGGEVERTARAAGAAWRWSAAGLTAAYLAFGTAGMVMILEGRPVGTVARTVGAGILFFGLAGVCLAARAAVHPRLDARSRRAWRWMAAGHVVLFLASVLYAAVAPHEHPGRFPLPGDVMRLAFVPLVVTGLLTLPMRTQPGVQRWTLALDAAVVTVASGIPLWYLQVGPALAVPGIGLERIAAATAYPLGDLLMIFGVAVVLLRGVSASARRPLWLLAAATGFWLAGDGYLGYVNGQGLSVNRASWQYPCWLSAYALMAAAAFQQCRWAGGEATAEPLRLRPVSRLPYLAVASGLAILLVATVREAAWYPLGGMVLGASILVGLVSARQMVAQNDQRRMAVTDALTGLANRMSLTEALSRALARSARSGRGVAVLLADLDGFKEVNDSLGHQAGDQVLVAFSRVLRRAVLGSDVVGRLGGDEFAVVLHDLRSPQDAETVAERIIAGMREPVLVGDVPLRMRGSIGIAVGEPGELALDDLMHRADMAMYRAKRHLGGGWHRYGTDETPQRPDPSARPSNG